MQRIPEAERAVSEALGLPPDPRGIATLQGARGAVALAAGRLSEALTAFDLALAAPGLTPDNRVEILERRARALDAVGRPREAIDAAAQGIEAIERLRASLVPRDYFKRGFDRSWSRLFALSVRRLAEQGEATRALEVTERARARAFADLVASRQAQRSPSLAARSAAATPMPLVVRGATSTRRGPGMTIESAIEVRSASVEEMQVTARDQATTLIAYWVDEHATWAWVVTPTGAVYMQRLPMSQVELQRAVAVTVGAPGSGGAAFTAGAAARAAYRRLNDVLVEPLRSWLPARDGLITIVPHGVLFRLSFAALTDRRGRYLIEDHPIAYAPSVAVLRLLHERGRREGPRAYVLVGNPTLPSSLTRSRGFASLPGAAREVEAIRRGVAPAPAIVLGRTEASESAVRRHVDGASVLHFATHAITDDLDPLGSFLALASDAPEPDRDGRLTAEEIYDLWLDADLVVLSACRSATGPITGDGLLGLTRAFFASGARSVVATLWDLPDEAGRRLLPRFYREWLATGDKARALRHAQLAWLADLRSGRVVVQSPLGAVTIGEDPALWAGLVLQGAS
jgi:CHAT domain-containing protein